MVKAKLSTFTQKEWFVKAYTGQESGCRCGCRGEYFFPGSRGFTRAINKAFKLDPEVFLTDKDEDINRTNGPVSKLQEEVLSGKRDIAAFGWTKNGKIDWIDIILPNDRTITLYTKE